MTTYDLTDPHLDRFMHNYPGATLCVIDNGIHPAELVLVHPDGRTARRVIPRFLERDAHAELIVSLLDELYPPALELAEYEQVL